VGPALFGVRDLGSRNGTTLVTARKVVTRAEIGPDETVRIGHTQLRIRPRDHPVADELATRRRNWARHPLAFAVMLIAAAAAVSAAYYQDSFDVLEASPLFVRVFATACAVVVWSFGWSFAGRTVTGRWNYFAHGAVAGAAVVAFLALDELTSVSAFALGSPLLREWAVLVMAAVFAFLCFRHLRLLSRGGRLRLAICSLAGSFILFGAITLLTRLHAREEIGRMNYLSQVYPPAWRLALPVSTDNFLSQVEALRQRVDKERSER
jgi:hypothetical protein